ncbi:hypothetical protein LSH36_212g03042 [Paralvinella palmiformis]|uniref:Sarcoplasmic reticulum histidine-rich calcium-binding protein n=1 Tax=Paralvinella palmiformis TaxID=53620 RepID=A0AAD9JPZ7_9ANNE|nr:hypothetical protein LSH36_212g03042 [Paralvinella palmiformis]
MHLWKYFFLTFIISVMLLLVVNAEESAQKEADENLVEVDEEKLDYAKGSVCGYCQYCEFCTLCDKDCPCEVSPTKPNCHMCKYCKFCYLCSAVCDTICQPGGFVDKVTASIINALPSHNQKEVESDIKTVEKVDRPKAR